uniref:Uncharacterized protein n=1 Tax=Anguilla anguilla TaxID=7936 RepID=A0A0E9PKB6_ANGAN
MAYCNVTQMKPKFHHIRVHSLRVWRCLSGQRASLFGQRASL